MCRNGKRLPNVLTLLAGYAFDEATLTRNSSKLTRRDLCGYCQHYDTLGNIGLPGVFNRLLFDLSEWVQ